MSATTAPAPPRVRAHLLYHFCRLQLPAVGLTPSACERHLLRTWNLHQEKKGPISWEEYLDNLHALDWFLTCACLEGNQQAWEHLFAARAGRSDRLLPDALRAQVVRCFPRNEERQESAITEFWSSLYVPPERDGALPILARYDGLRPLVPWLIKVFHNWLISDIRKERERIALGDDEAGPAQPEPRRDEWHEVFCEAARDWLTTLSDKELLILGLRLRYRLSQREVAQVLEIHEGTISRNTDRLSEQFKATVSERMRAGGWTGEDLSGYVHVEMYNLLLDDPQLSVEHLARVLTRMGKKVPVAS